MAKLTVYEFDAACERRWSTIEWRQPLNISILGLGDKIGCRFCIARHGLKAAQAGTLSYLFDQPAEFATHFAEVHVEKKA